MLAANISELRGQLAEVRVEGKRYCLRRLASRCPFHITFPSYCGVAQACRHLASSVQFVYWRDPSTNFFTLQGHSAPCSSIQLVVSTVTPITSARVKGMTTIGTDIGHDWCRTAWQHFIFRYCAERNTCRHASRFLMLFLSDPLVICCVPRSCG
jgi:hypothetical protein